jgi:hypothetical protein
MLLPAISLASALADVAGAARLAVAGDVALGLTAAALSTPFRIAFPPPQAYLRCQPP